MPEKNKKQQKTKKQVSKGAKEQKNNEPNKKDQKQVAEQLVERKHVIFIDIDDEITTIYDKIVKTRLKNIFLMIPEGAMIFQSVINLSILKEKSEQKRKEISIITKDKNGITLSKQASIPVFQKLDLPKKKFAIASDSKMAISPIMATSNEMEDDEPRRIVKRKISIRDLVQKRRSVSARTDKPLPTVSPVVKKQKKKPKELPSVLYLRPTKRTIITLLSVSIVLLLVISYIALPGATIQLWPRSSIIQRSVNISFIDGAKNKRFLSSTPKHTIGTVPVSTTATVDLTYKSTGKVFTGTSAEGDITIINKRPTPWTLVKNTRFQSPEGFIYRIDREVTVPAGRNGQDGTAQAHVIADDKDALDQIIGAKGNIGPTTFFLPGLRESSRETLFAKSTTPFVGGSTAVTTTVVPEDIEAARQQVAKKVREVAIQTLKEQTTQYNTEQDTQLTLFDQDKALRFGDIQYTYDPSIEGQALNTFVMSAAIPVKGLMYNKKSLLADLSSSLEEARTPGKIITDMELDSLTYAIFEASNSLDQVKATIGIQGVEQFALNDEDEASQALISKIKERVKGLELQEAENFIQNLPEINKVSIKAWPFWAPQLPHLPENISIAIVSEPY